MIVHIVLFNVKETSQTKQENILQFKTALDALPNHIREIQKLEVGLNFNESPNGWDLSLYTEFNSKEDLNTYQIHPEHLKVVELVKQITTDRAVSDYER